MSFSYYYIVITSANLKFLKGCTSKTLPNKSNRRFLVLPYISYTVKQHVNKGWLSKTSSELEQ